ncbi:MAG TPA: PAS domain-containing protein [Qipengyuania sp.]|nr:PAS domain-containing protein [Qipengyuania sp.]
MTSGFLDRYRAETADVLDAVLSHSRDCIKLLNVRGEIECASASAVGALGLAEPDDAIGKIWSRLWPEQAQPELESAIAVAATGVSTRFDGATLRADGTARHWQVTISPVRSADGSVTHLLAVSTDVTAQVEAAERGRQRWERAERQVDRAGDVTRELRHRLKNQLAVVGAVARLLARHTDDAKDLARKLERKLIALAHAQDLLTILRDDPIGAREAVEEVLRASGAGERVEIGAMPTASLPDESVQQLALLLGELQTNALKHGALRDELGEVRLAGMAEGQVLTLRWEEDCRQPVVPVEVGDGGFQLIRRLGSAGNRQPVIAWLPTGIAVEFHLRTA